MDRRQKADEKYRQMFYELGLDATFDYIGFERKDHIWFRCKKCGREAPRSNDVFKGRQKRLLCRNCGNGMRIYSPEVDDILAYYSEGHSVTETCEKFGINKTRLNNWVKIRRITNGKTFREGGQECNKRRAEESARLCVVLVHNPHNASHYLRAKMRGASAEIGITLPKLFKRDNGVCQICGMICYFSNDYCADLYPTIDHIVPISKGGSHTWNNVQLAHRICNLNKRDYVGKEWHNGDC